jgi:uncharacterized RDD family membrane protein YckC
MILVARRRLQGQYAGFASRLIAFVVDMLLIQIVIVALSAGIWMILNFFLPGNQINNLRRDLQLGGADGGFSPLLATISLIVFVVFYILYPAIMLMLVGWTPGKAMLGLRVATMDGRRLTFARAVGRQLGYWVSALPLFLGFLWILVDDQRQGWHDMLANTCVIYAWHPHQLDPGSGNLLSGH